MGKMDMPRGDETVLLVEDNQEARAALRRILEWHGYRVLTADDADTAEEVARANGSELALLIADIVLPGRTGVALARALAQDFPGLRVLLMSGYTDREVDRGELGGIVSGFLAKPMTIRQLAFKVRELLDQPTP